MEDPRHTDWRGVLRPWLEAIDAPGRRDRLTEALKEELNVAWAAHELSAVSLTASPRAHGHLLRIRASRVCSYMAPGTHTYGMTRVSQLGGGERGLWSCGAPGLAWAGRCGTPAQLQSLGTLISRGADLIVCRVETSD